MNLFQEFNSLMDKPWGAFAVAIAIILPWGLRKFDNKIKEKRYLKLLNQALNPLLKIRNEIQKNLEELKDATDEIDALYEICDQLSDAFSGSWESYHKSRKYYKDFVLPMGSISSFPIQNSRECSKEEVELEILRRLDKGQSITIDSILKPNQIENFIKFKDGIILRLATIIDCKADSFLNDKKKVLENINLISKESSQVFYTPHHIKIQQKTKKIKDYLNKIKLLGSNLESIIQHIKNQQGK